MIRNIVFDWSGTLVDDLPAVWKATNMVLQKAGLEPWSMDRFRAEFRLPFTEFYEQITPHVDMERLEVWFHEGFRQVRDSVRNQPHAHAFLEFCRDHQIRMFLLSTITEDHFHHHAARAGLASWFERTYLGVWDKRSKIHEILKDNQLDPAETLFIGDMVHDVDTARHGGIHACAVLTGYTLLPDLRACRPDLIVEHLGELRQLLEAHDFAWPITQNRRAGAQTAFPIATVGALIQDEADQVLMLRTHKWSGLWGIPGGKIKWGETSVEALRREILEETGLTIEDVSLVMVQDCIQSTEFYQNAHFLLLNYLCRTPGVSPVVCLNEEAVECCWVSTEAALGMRLNQPTRSLLNSVLAPSIPRPLQVITPVADAGGQDVV